ncbi:hypothetical protein QQX98_006923 [Neonectria punicea]|uniref:SNF2 N-terminal domain-containing protein n=1 Tax=Neonectria punicea TaxID=979145 RepID=A0ABR1GZV8_9HYPO
MSKVCGRHTGLLSLINVNAYGMTVGRRIPVASDPGTKSGFVDEGARVIPSDGSKKRLNALRNASDKPATVRTVISKTYPTCSTRTVQRCEEKFVWLRKPEGEVEGDDARTAKPRTYTRDGVADSNIERAGVQTGGASELHKCGSCFEYLVVDEAHHVKRETGAHHSMLKLVPWNSLIWVTGTPLAASFKDLIMPLGLLWSALGVQWTPDVGELRWLLGLYDAVYDATKKRNAFRDEITMGISSGSENSSSLLALR